MSKKIGIVTMKYAEDGTFLNGSFEPTLNVEVPLELISKIKSSTAFKFVKENADLILGSFFSTLTDIELNQHVMSRQLGCERWPNNNIKSCSISYYYE